MGRSNKPRDSRSTGRQAPVRENTPAARISHYLTVPEAARGGSRGRGSSVYQVKQQKQQQLQMEAQPHVLMQGSEGNKSRLEECGIQSKGSHGGGGPEEGVALLTMAEVSPVERDHNLYWYKGFTFPKDMMTIEFVDSLQDFKTRDDDIFLFTYPKSGTIWTQQILSLICSEGHRNGTEKIDTADRVPWFEFPGVNKVYDHDSRPSPRMFSSHLPEKFCPSGLKNKKAKVIYVMRNPKDVMKSLYHFQDIAVMAQKSPNFQHFFEKFLDGEVFVGKWFDHLRGWYTQKDEYNILFLKYEDMRKDLRSVVKQICTFLGVKLDEMAIDIVVKKASFKEMKKDSLANKENMPENLIDKRFGSFMRKGQVGDWKNIITVAQNELFDQLFQEKMGDLSLDFTWDIPE